MRGLGCLCADLRGTGPGPGLCRVWPLRVLVAVMVLWAFVWMSPQGYYADYRVVFDDLPPRWVMPEAPSWRDMWGL
ncbi:hypothetical protein [Jannaschia sp. CCS1]|uniref:hypothetical protein n=1 Tax=Jannaschia sp. (strain CCS1) TaxID=290400 RepID=UPI0005C535D5|nr:hypothetical protein [Jannaschia sp. CCS1]